MHNDCHKTVRLFIMSAALIVLQSCSDSSTTPTESGPNYEEEFSFGKVTVLKDVRYGTDDYKYVAIGYRDSLGDGNREGLIVVAGNDIKLERYEYISAAGINSLDVLMYEPVTRTYFAAAEGSTAAENLFRFTSADSVSKRYVVPFEGSIVHPTEMLPDGKGNAAMSAWVEDAGSEKALIALVDSNGSFIWSHYYDSQGMSVHGEDMVHDDNGYAFACSYKPVIPGTEEVYSRIYLINQDGKERNSITIDIENFQIIGLELSGDTAYAVVGTIPLRSGSKGGYIGIIDKSGKRIWDGKLGQDSLFVPVSIEYIGDVRNYFPISGNLPARGVTFSLSSLYSGEFVLNGGSPLQTIKSGSYYMRRRDTRNASLSVGVIDAVYSGSDDLMESVAFIHSH